MATSKPISTISYNTTDFLVQRLQSLVSSEIIQSWFFICHRGEKKNDEVVGKDHIHLLIIPNKRVDLVKLGKEFIEIDTSNPDKPLKCMPFRNSGLDDWFLYALHNEDYLAQKGMEKEYHYFPEEIITSDPDYLSALLCDAFRSLASNPVRAIRDAVEHGISFEALLYSGRININQVNNARTLYNSMLRITGPYKVDFKSIDTAVPWEESR